MYFITSVGRPASEYWLITGTKRSGLGTGTKHSVGATRLTPLRTQFCLRQKFKLSISSCLRFFLNDVLVWDSLGMPTVCLYTSCLRLPVHYLSLGLIITYLICCDQRTTKWVEPNGWNQLTDRHRDFVALGSGPENI